MAFLQKNIQVASYAFFGLLIVAMGVVSLHITMETMFAVSVLMFATCALSAIHLFGLRGALGSIALAIALGFFAEYTGHNYGWFFGDYDFTDALGFRLLGVPVVIPLMWFNMTYMCFVLGNIILHRAPLPASNSLATSAIGAFFSAMLVTAYDLGADPYMVFVVKGWTMAKTDGWWFGETLQGFIGWLIVSFVIIAAFKLLARPARAATMAPFKKIHALIPILIYADLMAFQILFGHPVETRTIAVFAMGIPVMVALFSFASWSWNESTGAPK